MSAIPSHSATLKINFMTGRIYQDTHFNLSILNGLPIEQLKGKHISAIFAQEVAGNSEITFLLEEGEKLRLYYCPTEDKSYFIKKLKQ